MPSETRTRAAVLRRMAELGIGRFNKDLAEATGVGEAAIGSLLNEETDNPQRRTLRAIAEALQWPADWLDHIKRGETPPAAAGGATVDLTDALLESKGAVARVDHRSGRADPEGRRRTVEQFAMQAGAAIASAAGDTGLDVALDDQELEADARLQRDGEPVAVVEWQIASRDTMYRSVEIMQALRLRTSVRYSDEVAVILYLVGPPGFEEIVEDFTDQVTELTETYDVIVAVGEEQLRWALEEIAAATG